MNRTTAISIIKELEEAQFAIRYQSKDKCTIERMIRNVMGEIWKQVINDNSYHAVHRHTATTQGD